MQKHAKIHTYQSTLNKILIFILLFILFYIPFSNFFVEKENIDDIRPPSAPVPNTTPIGFFQERTSDLENSIDHRFYQTQNSTEVDPQILKPIQTKIENKYIHLGPAGPPGPPGPSGTDAPPGPPGQPGPLFEIDLKKPIYINSSDHYGYNNNQKSTYFLGADINQLLQIIET